MNLLSYMVVLKFLKDVEGDDVVGLGDITMSTYGIHEFLIDK